VNIEGLEGEVTRLEDVRAIEDLERIYGYYFDTRQMKQIVDLFSDDHTDFVEIESHGRFFGKEGVKRMYLEAVGGEPPASDASKPQAEPRSQATGGITLIIQLDGVVTVAPNGKTAKGRWHTWLAESFPFAGTLGQYWLHGYYENEFVKERGRWLFTRLFWNTTFITRFETGWMVQPIVGFLPMPNPDMPMTAFHPYPSGYHFAYSFPHPTTGETDEGIARYHHPMAT
jgi:hypothetical protein